MEGVSAEFNKNGGFMGVLQWFWQSNEIKPVWQRFRRETESHTTDNFLEEFTYKRKKRQSPGGESPGSGEVLKFIFNGFFFNAERYRTEIIGTWCLSGKVTILWKLSLTGSYKCIDV